MHISNCYDPYVAKRAEDFQVRANLAHTYIEKPAMYAQLPDVTGKTLLCVGCGTGEECGELLNRGSLHVTGVDISDKAIVHAKGRYPGVEFVVADMDTHFLPEESVDFVYSSLAVHYSKDLQRLFTRLHRTLKPGGILLFSTLHPIKWAAQAYRDPDDLTGKKSFIMGYSRNGRTVRVWGDYLQPRQVTQQLPDGPLITYWTRPISSLLSMLRKARFTLLDFIEPQPVPDVREGNAYYWEIHSRIPQFMIFKVQKPTTGPII